MLSTKLFDWAIRLKELYFLSQKQISNMTLMIGTLLINEIIDFITRLSIIWKSDLTDKMKRSFFQAAVVSILLYGCTT